ncbi:MAG: glutamine synthetase [Gammaproteobacteria bacterium]|nr:glutamine synthetase [Gammaproteobacteria bacterium]
MSISALRREAFAAEAAAFRVAHGDVEAVDAFVIDFNGHALGKRVPVSDLAALARSGVQFSAGALLHDVRGMGQGPLGLGTTDGDPDGNGWPIPGTLVRVPWARRPTAQVQLELRAAADDAPLWWDPRVLLADVVARCRAVGLHPVVACELEFYLVAPERASGGPVAVAPLPRTGLAPRVAANLSVAALEEHARFIDAIRAAAAVQDLPVTSAVTEYGIGQFEINLLHIADPVKAADQAVLLRRLVQGVARACGFEASFIPKPFRDQPGSGLHLHVSVTDAAGSNRFGAPQGEALLRQAIAGLQALAGDSLGLFAPHFNAHRRFQGVFVPRAASWGFNNRSVAFRLPIAGPEARRIEHRIAAADASPHLVMAAVLAGILHGISERLEPGPEAQGEVREVQPAFSAGLLAALARLEHSPLLARYFPQPYLTAYAHVKRGEYQDLIAEILPAELDFYL